MEKPKQLSKIERLQLKAAQLNAQLKDARTQAKSAEREKEDRQKYNIGGHFYEWIKNNPNDDFTKALQNHMIENLRGKTTRAELDLPPRPDLDLTNPQKRRAQNRAGKIANSNLAEPPQAASS